MWSIPLTLHMSPAAIGCSEVRLRGRPSRSNRTPSASSTASGHPSADEDETVTMAPSGISATASEAARTLGLATLSDFVFDGGGPRHCEERSEEAIQRPRDAAPGLLRYARNDG